MASSPHTLSKLGAAALIVFLPELAPAQVAEMVAPLNAAMAEAEASLRAGEPQVAESHYRDALREGWLLAGRLDAGAGRLVEARAAFANAARASVVDTEALQSMAIVALQSGKAADAVAELSRLGARAPNDFVTRRLLAQALIANAQPEEAVQELEKISSLAPEDPELQFLLASGYLRLKKVAAAEALFARVAAARSIPETWVLIGRTYRDFGELDLARAAFERALKMDPRVRRAHYYLGTIAVMIEGTIRFDVAIAEFREELTLDASDPVASLRLGMVLVEARRAGDALSPLEVATRSPDAPPEASYYLGRAQLALGRPRDALASLERALALAQGMLVGPAQLGRLHYQLATTLRALGEEERATASYADAERFSVERAKSSRDVLARYLAEAPEPESLGLGQLAEVWLPYAALPPGAREELSRTARTMLARACFNLGVLHAQAARHERAAAFFEEAAAIDPAFPQVQYSLGVAYFNAKQYAKAGPPLERALAASPQSADVRRMLALAWLNAENYPDAAELLRNDPRRESDLSLQFAYGLALVRSDRAADAETIFTELLAAHRDSAELNVLLGQAHAQQGDFDAAVTVLRRALELKPAVADANGSLGVIFLKQGRLEEAIDALRAELTINPADNRARTNLAVVLDMQGQPGEAIALLRAVLTSQPQHVDARYQLGKVLLAEGAATEAVEHLETAARESPADANVHYQLGKAYQKLGRLDAAEREFALFEQLKDKRRGQ